MADQGASIAPGVSLEDFLSTISLTTLHDVETVLVPKLKENFSLLLSRSERKPAFLTETFLEHLMNHVTVVPMHLPELPMSPHVLVFLIDLRSFEGGELDELVSFISSLTDITYNGVKCFPDKEWHLKVYAMTINVRHFLSLA